MTHAEWQRTPHRTRKLPANPRLEQLKNQAKSSTSWMLVRATRPQTTSSTALLKAACGK